MPDRSRVTIVVPTLDPGPSRLGRCLDSLERQTHPDVEIIVMDGGSTDGSRELVRDRAGVTLVAEPDDGQADAIRRGFERAAGDLLGWLGADDTLATDAVERVAAALADRPDAGWAYGSVRLVEDGRSRILTPPDELEPADFYWGDPVSQPGSLVTRAALDAVGGIDPTYRYAMDLDLWVRLVDAGFPGVRVDAVLADFEVHPGSKTGSAGPEVFLREEARSYRSHGWLEPAALTLGQAIAVQAGGGARTDDLRRQVEAVVRDPAWSGLSADLIEAGALTRAAIDGLRDGPQAIRYLLHPAPWRHPATRRRLVVAGRRLATRLVGGDPGTIQNR